MRVLVGSYLPGYTNNNGKELSPKYSGGAVAAIYITKAIRKKGVDVEVIAPGFIDTEVEIDGIPITLRQNLLRSFRNNLRFLGTTKSQIAYRKHREIFYQIFKNKRYDIYHAHALEPFGVGPIAAADELGIPAIITLHNSAPICFMNDLISLNGKICEGNCRMSKFIFCLFHQPKLTAYMMLIPIFLAIKNKTMNARQKMCSKIGAIVTPSEYLRDLLIKHGLPENKLFKI